MRHPTKNTRTNTFASAIGVALALLLAMAAAAAAPGLMGDAAGGVQAQTGVQVHGDDGGPDGGTGAVIGATTGASLGDTLRTQDQDRNQTQDRIHVDSSTNVSIALGDRNQTQDRDQNRTQDRDQTHLENGSNDGVQAEFRVGGGRTLGANVSAQERERAETRVRLEAEHRASFMAARDRYENATEQYRAARQELAQTRANEHSQLGFEVRKRVALTAADTLDSYVRMLQAHVNASSELSVQERAQIETQLRSYGAWLADQSVQINASTDAGQLAGVIGQMHERWAHVKNYAQLAAGKSVLAQAQLVQTQAETASQKVHAEISTIAAAGGNVSAARTLATEFDAHLNASATHLANAQAAYAQANDTASVSYATAVNELDAAKADLRAAYDALRRIVAELHVAASTEASANGGVSA